MKHCSARANGRHHPSSVYVLGPGHRWPYLLLRLYQLMELLPATRDGAKRLGLVTEPMTQALVRAVETPAQGVRIVEVPQIRVPGGFSQPASVRESA